MDKKKISIILAIVLAAMAVVMVRNYISRAEKKFIKEEKKAYVLVAAKNIPAGTTLDETMVRFDPIPVKYVQPKAINSQSLAVGKRAIADIFEGEQVLMSKLTIAVKNTSLAMRTPQGKRAITLTIPRLSAVGGKIRTGDYIDVIGTFNYTSQVDGKTVSEPVSVTLFQNILVLGIDSGAPAQRGRPEPVRNDLVLTLALTPRQIAILSFAMERGKLRLVLRPPLETAIEPVPPVEATALWQYVFSNLGQEFLATQEDRPPPIIRRQEPEKEKHVAPPPPTVEVYRGTEKSKMILR